jgi:hypothetical protein
MQTDSPQSQSNPIASFSNPWPAVPAGLEARPYDHWNIDLQECWEAEFWMKHLSCEEPALRDAVLHVGARVGAVRAYLESHS